MSVLSEQHSGQSSSGGIAGGYGGVVSAIRERRENRQSQNWSAYSDLLRSLASGEVVDDVECDLTLQMVGRSLVQLESDVAVMRRRLAWAKLIEEEPQRLALERSRERELQTALDELAEAKRRLGAVVAEKRLAYRAVADRAGLASDARTHLLQTCMDQGLIAREEKLTPAIMDLRNQIRETEEAIEKRRYELATIQQNRAVSQKHTAESIQVYPPTDVRGDDNVVARERHLRSEIESHQQDLAMLRSRMSQLQQEQDRIASQKLLP